MQLKLIALIMMTTSFATSNSHNNYTTMNRTSFLAHKAKDMQMLDSLLASYKNELNYYVEYSNDECLFEIRINDMYLKKIWTDISIGGTVAPINGLVLRPGKQKVSIKLLPMEGETLIRYPEPFSLRIGYKDFTLPDDTRPWHWILEMPQPEIPPQGIPSYEWEGVFEAKLLRSVEGWSECIDLREIPDIEERVVAEFKRIRQLFVDKEMDKIEQLFYFRDLDVGKSFQLSSQEYEEDWLEWKYDIMHSKPEEWQEIEDYQLVFYGDGRLVTLESKKENHYFSALLRFRYFDHPNDPELEILRASAFDLRLGILKGTNEFIPIR